MRPPRVPYRGFFWSEKMEHERVVCFVDGFNLYHAIDAIKQPHLKWLNLRQLFTRLTRTKSQIITQILYFSAYPT
jgi:ferritin